MLAETLFDLLRHGETAGGRRLRGARCDDPLSERGREQLERATAVDPGWDLVVASPQARCRAFAESLAASLDRPCHIDERLREYDFGDWDGRAFDDLWRDHGEALASFLGDPDAVMPPGGESAADFRTRVRAARDDLLEHHAGRRILLLGHGGVLRQLVADALRLDGSAHAALEWPHAAMSRLRVIDDRPHPRTTTLVFHARMFDGGRK